MVSKADWITVIDEDYCEFAKKRKNFVKPSDQHRYFEQ